MDIVLMAVTALSLVMAAGMAVIVAKLLREDRARSEARVSALTALAAEPAASVTASAPAPLPRRTASRPEAPLANHSAPAPPADDLELRPASLSTVGDLFAEHERPSPWGRRAAVIGLLAAAGAAILVVATTRQTPGAGPTTTTAAATASEAVPAPLELRALRHTEEAQSFVVSGIVHNPRSSAPLTAVVATAFAFGSDGGFLSSGRAPVDFTTLGPGDESPFVVTVPVTGRVARYRIGFRTEDGRVISHVDKRTPDALASK